MSPPAAHLALGRAAEEAACIQLERLGYRIVQRNFRGRGGELDIVAMDGRVLALVEVRYRSRNDFGGAAGSITHVKRARLIRAARELMRHEPALARLAARFDVMEVDGPLENLRCRLIRDAFSL